MISIDLDTLDGHKLDAKEMRYLFPKAIRSQYNMMMTGLLSYQLDLINWEVTPSGFNFSRELRDLEMEIEDQKRMNAIARHLATKLPSEVERLKS